MSESSSDQEHKKPDQFIRMLRLRTRTHTNQKLRQVALAARVGVDTRTLQQWENAERLPGADSLQRLIRALLIEKIFLPGEERKEARQLWEAVRRSYDARPGTYTFYPPFDERWFDNLLRLQAHETTEGDVSPSARFSSQQIPPSDEEDSGKERQGRKTPPNLPMNRTSFIGRRNEIAEIKGLLTTHALVTLTGSGGCGKTRLALHVAEELLETYIDGIWLIELAALTNPALVPTVVAATLGIQEAPEQSIVETLVTFLRPRHALLLVDNCEHLVEASALLLEHLLSTCPLLHLLTTSREALNISGEMIWRVPPLSLPTPEGSDEQARESEAVQLFRERARNVLSTFELTAHNTPAIVQICRQLEGIPLALELVATRMNVLSADQLATSLTDRFPLLAAGRRTVTLRHQTLRATVDWSFDLLTEKEQVLFLRLSIFACACTLETIEAVCAWSGETAQGMSQTIEPQEVLGLLSQLVNKSLVEVQPSAHGSDTRYRLLETMKLYGREKLEEQQGPFTREGLLLQERHAHYYADFIERAEVKFRSGERETWLIRVREEYENVRAALQWSQTGEASSSGVGLRLVSALYWFWLHEGTWSEGRHWLQKVLNSTETPTNSPGWAKALHGLGVLAWASGNKAEAERLASASVTMARQSAQPAILAASLRLQVQILLNQEDLVAARDLAETSVLYARDQGDPWNLASSLSTLSLVLCTQQEYARAHLLCEESKALFLEVGDRWELTGPLRTQGHIAFLQEDYDQATYYYKESIALCQEIRGPWFLSRGLQGLAAIESAKGQYLRATTLLGAAEQLRETVGAAVMPAFRTEYDQMIALAKRNLNPEVFNAAWLKGKRMSPEQSIFYALQTGSGS